MLLAGSDDGVYRLTDPLGASETTVQKVLDAGPVQRLRTVSGYDGAFAATGEGLYYTADGETWTDLDVPESAVYSVGGDESGRLYAGTRPAHVFVAEGDSETPPTEWRELTGFQELPSRSEWQLPRHDNLAQVRDLHAPASDRVVAGVEVGGVHVSTDAGEEWQERRDGVDDDIHELAVAGSTYVAATGFGLFRSTDDGASWTRLDEGFDQRYFRAAAFVDGDLYAGAALAHTATWDDPDSDPALFVVRGDGTVEQVAHPRSDETVTGVTELDGRLAIATYRGAVLVRDGDWELVGRLSAADSPAGSYTPLCQLEG